MDEHLTRHMEQGDGESHTLPHEEHHQQENNLKHFTSSVEVFSLMIIVIFFSLIPAETCYNVTCIYFILLNHCIS